MHSLPRVRELAERFPDSLSIIGVHAGKFPAERSTRRIRSAMERLDVRHPVVNDRQFRIWRAYGVSVWPTVAIVSPDGYVLTTIPGEFAFEEIANIIERSVAAYSRAGQLERGPSPLPETRPPDSGFPLRFPGRVIQHGDDLYVSDTGHHRVLRLRLLQGRACPAKGPTAIIDSSWGSGIDGFVDGSPDHACFGEPQGLAVVGERLYIADRSNHAVRCVDLATDLVTTVAGTGELGTWGVRPGPGPTTRLRSPWGLAVWGDDLLISMAGSHQLWRMALDGSASLSLVAGAGAEGIGDGPAAEATLAQPTGLAVHGGALHFSDAESSSVRELPHLSAEVRTIVGTGLFDFGDRDGEGDRVLLQHPEDLAWHDGRLYVTDSYNDKIKAVDPTTRRCETLRGPAGDGETLRTPSGITSGDGYLVVADTDSHRIAVVVPGTGAVRTLRIE